MCSGHEDVRHGVVDDVDNGMMMAMTAICDGKILDDLQGRTMEFCSVLLLGRGRAGMERASLAMCDAIGLAVALVKYHDYDGNLVWR